MQNLYRHFRNSALALLLTSSLVYGQHKPADSSSYYNKVKTYVNPVLPGDHPDPTLLKVGNDFYHCGSSFHFNPYLPVYHSKDLVHWQIISRVVPPSRAAKVTDNPSAGIWQGAITYFYGSYWIYFSANGQWFCKAASPKGPWSAPVQVLTPKATGPLGYDNSIFVDDDGKPYMVIKNGQTINRLQAVGRDGQLTDTVINLDWINAHRQYSWAEGPVMCKRNGYYYYFPAGDVSGGQYVLRATALTSDSTKWERLGNFFKPITDPNAGFRSPNHIAAPVQLADGSWWTIGQSYERVNGDDWSGTGRQTSLYPIVWEGDRPWGLAPVSTPINRPNLPQSGILWRSVHTDYFDADSLNLAWHFLNRKAATSYSLTDRKGWMRLLPGSQRTHVLQKETDHYYTAVTRVSLEATKPDERAGIYLTNGNEKVAVSFGIGYSQGGKQIILELDTAKRSIPNSFGNTVWLKLVRYRHELSGFCSADGIHWTSVGKSLSTVSLDKVQPNYNSWVGTSIGLFAEGHAADFDCFICKDGFSDLPAVGYSNYYGVQLIRQGADRLVTNTSGLGGWFMISGTELGSAEGGTSAIEISAQAAQAAKLEIWLDDLEKGNGRLIAIVPIVKTPDGSLHNTVVKLLKKVTGQHDVFVKFSSGAPHSVLIKSVRFVSAKGPSTAGAF